MKKLKLKALELGAMELLTRAQLKNVLGGDDYGYGIHHPTYSCTATPKIGYHMGSLGSCTNTLQACNTQVSNWCANTVGCASASCG